eukprot:TRINITY_DN6477_c0_g1_i1.p1 TRINITY_DN6477_c0_g1~~TRINITY_DN6477_c0_g1_i1.p1  ORF type:complete len:1038 (+),score=243.59 TRINITY_DN6477_c0_g1_i1:194-3307(+)
MHGDDGDAADDALPRSLVPAAPEVVISSRGTARSYDDTAVPSAVGPTPSSESKPASKKGLLAPPSKTSRKGSASSAGSEASRASRASSRSPSAGGGGGSSAAKTGGTQPKPKGQRAAAAKAAAAMWREAREGDGTLEGGGAPARTSERSASKAPRGSKRSDAPERPNEAFGVGSTIVVLSRLMLRLAEELASQEVCELEPGQRCVVKGRGQAKSGKRLQVAVQPLSKGLQGWISVVSKTDRVLICAAPSPVAARVEAHGKSSSALFELGDEVEVMSVVVLRGSEKLESEEIGTLPEGMRGFVICKGAGKRLQVNIPELGLDGWLSCTAKSGRPLLKVVEPLGVEDVVRRDSSGAGKAATTASADSGKARRKATGSSSSSSSSGATVSTSSDGDSSSSDGQRRGGLRLRIDPQDAQALTWEEFQAKYRERSYKENQNLWQLAAKVNCDYLPLRRGTKPCKAWIESGSCKFGLRCRYTHPESSCRKLGKTTPKAHGKTTKTVVRVLAGEGDDDLGWEPAALPPNAIVVLSVAPGSWAHRHGLAPGDELIDVGGLAPSSYEDHAFLVALLSRPAWLTFRCERTTTGEPVASRVMAVEEVARSRATRACHAAEPGAEEPGGAYLASAASGGRRAKSAYVSPAGAVGGLFRGVGRAFAAVTNTGSDWLHGLTSGIADLHEASKDRLARELGAALAKDDSRRINALLDGALGGNFVADSGPSIIRSTAKAVASRQLRHCLKTEADAKALKGALVAAKRLHAESVPEYQLAMARYKEVKQFPPNWDVSKMITNRRGSKMLSKSYLKNPKVIQRFQRLLDLTHRKVYTRDRHGHAVPDRLVVQSVVEVANDNLWVDYMARQEEIRRELVLRPVDYDHIETDSNSALTESMKGEDSDALDSITAVPLDPLVNEVLLFHGTNPLASDDITTNNFQVNLAGSNAGSLYGRGVYFAENGSKSDEYTSCDSLGNRTLLLCRVTLGCVYQTEEVQPEPRDCEKSCLEGPYHAVLGDRRKCRGTFREFVVFDEEQVYASYIITYKREVTRKA